MFFSFSFFLGQVTAVISLELTSAGPRHLHETIQR